ncbi:solute carrier family 31 (copper transporter), member 1 [Sporothrix brasiliensis 5110]|uniref:Copper transport protein n=1 Tax=Sporothrix brasiliensis 5110 TaxID=1398154 RepID=A0A0C2ELK9_9PEZI|nr:solute carrier family 31 (copper transporter), member 1 [Sporothrix brasiliensis 5110]KIH86999.1 solute carrier family 31 (copper transporter), member 1 [Sporothrix brasiliensis 5110]
MDHSHHHMAEGADMPMDRCTMNMLFTWDTNNLCIVFRWWHIRTTPGLILSLLAVVALGAGYEALREGIRRYEMVLAKRAEAVPRQAQVDVNKRAHVTKAVLYGIQNFYAFMIMLVFMTYNGWVMLSVSIGAFVGYLLFGGATPVVKETACH